MVFSLTLGGTLLLRIFREFEERKRLEQELKLAVEIRDDFLSVASHELKTPLTALCLQLELLKRFTSAAGEMPDRRILGVVKSAYQSSYALSALIDDLLDVTRIRIGKLTLHWQEIDLREVLLESVESIRESAAKRGSNITVKANDPVRGVLDSKRVNQIYLNLLSNAIKYGEGNLIEVRLTSSTEPSGHAPVEVARIEIEDHGIGIPNGMEKKIFERFQRVSKIGRAHV